MYRSKKTIEIGVILLFIITTTFVSFVVWAQLDFFNNSKSLTKDNFYKLLLLSFVRTIIIDAGLIFFYYRDKKKYYNKK
jgi:hypothetical protein